MKSRQKASSIVSLQFMRWSLVYRMPRSWTENLLFLKIDYSTYLSHLCQWEVRIHFLYSNFCKAFFSFDTWDRLKWYYNTSMNIMLCSLLLSIFGTLPQGVYLTGKMCILQDVTCSERELSLWGMEKLIGYVSTHGLSRHQM